MIDLLDNFLKAGVKDKRIKPFGGVLYGQSDYEYEYAWNPQGINFGP